MQNKSLNQFQFLKNHVEYLEGEITKLEADTITASALATDWDNKLRKINQLIMAADELYEDAGTYYQKNLIGRLSRTSFQTQTFLAPYNSNGDNHLISGIYLGVDYFLTETSPGSEFWNSDTASVGSEEATGTLTEYTSFPDSPTGNTEDVTNINFTGFTNNSGSGDVVTFRQTDGTNVTATITRGGLGLLDAWLYDDFSTSVDSNSKKRKAGWSAAAHIGGKDISLWTSAYPSGFQPYRNSHFIIDEWVSAGYDKGFIRNYLESEANSYNHPNAAIEPRIPGIFQYYSVAEDELQKIFAGQYSAQKGADNIAAAWERITDQIGRKKQIQLYRASLGLS